MRRNPQELGDNLKGYTLCIIKGNSTTMKDLNYIQEIIEKNENPALGISDFEQSPLSTVYLMDCIKGMKHFPDKHFDLAIVDPPYGINAPNMQMGSHPTRRRKDGFGGPGISTAVKLKGRLNTGSGKLKNRLLNKSKIEWDNSKPSEEYFQELFRVSKNQIIWGGNYFDLPASRCVLCWDKCQPWDNFSQWEMAWTSFDKPAALFKYSNTGGANTETKIHPTQKPVKLYDWLLMNYAKEGQLILDTHLGSQSSRIAAHKSGLDFIGFEINRDYFNDGNKRFRNFASQGVLSANGKNLYSYLSQGVLFEID